MKKRSKDNFENSFYVCIMRSVNNCAAGAALFIDPFACTYMSTNFHFVNCGFELNKTVCFISYKKECFSCKSE